MKARYFQWSRSPWLLALSVAIIAFFASDEVQAREIIVQGADEVRVERFERPRGLAEAASIVGPRIVLEHVDLVYRELFLERSVGLEKAASVVPPRIIIQYARSTSLDLLNRPSFFPPIVRNLVALQKPTTPLVEITYEVYDARDFVVVYFQFWDGTNWVDCVTTTGEGRVRVGKNTGTWNALADIGRQYRTDMKIRVIADNGEPVNNIAIAVSAPFVLNTR